MISEKEIRIGNLFATIRSNEIAVTGIDTENKFVTIDRFDNNLDSASKTDSSVILEDLLPIELNELKLMQLGFTKTESLSVSVASDKGARFEWDEKTGLVVLTDGNSGIIGQGIRYVHQLQNAYYYLTGRELLLM